MKFRVLFRKIAAFALVLTSFSAVFAQPGKAPKQEKLLNGLKLLIWNDPAADKVTVKIRIHSGAAFDPQGKEGVMLLLAESFFPNDTARDFFKEDLGGGLWITANYDYIQVSATARPDEFVTLLESVATAVSNPTVDKETTTKLRGKRLEKIAELRKDPAYLAQLAAAKQLFGTFPYGRAELGTTESVSKIEFPDLLDAKQRFLTADNATVSIAGNIDTALAYRAARRYLGSWLKADKMTPSTFRQPDEPDTKMVKVTSEMDGDPHLAFALRGLARNDKDYVASVVLANILESRLKANVGASGTVFVDNSAHFLPGDIVFGFRAAADSETPNNLVTLLLSKAIGNDEFTAAKAQANNTIQRTAADEKWLDVDTYKLASAADEQKAFESVMLADVQRVAERLAKNPVVSVMVSKAERNAISN